MYCGPAAPHLLHILAGHLCLSSRRSSLLLLHTCLLPQLSCCSAEAKRQVKSVPLPFALAFTGLTYSTLCEGCPLLFRNTKWNHISAWPHTLVVYNLYMMYVHALHIKSIIIHAHVHQSLTSPRWLSVMCTVYTLTFMYCLATTHVCIAHPSQNSSCPLYTISLIKIIHTYIHNYNETLLCIICIIPSHSNEKQC